VLVAGDQVVFDGQHRFVVEFPAGPGAPARSSTETAAPAAAPPPARSNGVRLPWLLLAAILLAGALSALLWFGAPGVSAPGASPAAPRGCRRTAPARGCRT